MTQERPHRPVYAKMRINPESDDFARLLKVIGECGLNGVVIGNLNKHFTTLNHPEEAPSEC